MEAKPTYHLPPNFSTPPPDQGGPFHLGTVLRHFEKKEQMRPLNQGDRADIPERYRDHKGGFTATRKRLKSGQLGLWAKFMGLEGVGGEASVSAERSDTDTYTFDSVDTEFFYPSPKYISDCLELSDVDDYVKGARYKKPVYLVTGIKIGKGVKVRMERKTNVSGTLGVGINVPEAGDLQVGPRAEGTVEDEPSYIFTESSDILVGIQCLKIWHEKSAGLLGFVFGKGNTEVRSEYVTSGAAFYSGDNGGVSEQKLTRFVVGEAGGDDDDENKRGLVSHMDGSEIWMIPQVE
ncbi:hypothetical protein PG995_006655 [Apiospora arundinis]